MRHILVHGRRVLVTKAAVVNLARRRLRGKRRWRGYCWIGAALSLNGGWRLWVLLFTQLVLMVCHHLTGRHLGLSEIDMLLLLLMLETMFVATMLMMMCGSR